MHITQQTEAPKVDSSPMTPAGPVSAARPRRRALLLGAVALAATAGTAAWFTLERAPAIVTPAEAAMGSARLPDGSFRLSPAEARMLRIEPVTVRDFRPERVAEGRISYNEDRSTPIYPPYNGRVVRVVAQPGQSVRVGDVLFEIETTDLTSAANDLLAASDQVTRARNQVELTRRNDARQRELFAVRAAARRDVEQAEADHQNAQADLRTAEASVAAARDRLRVLGRDADTIAEIERTRRVNAVVPVVAPLAGTVVQRRVGLGQWLNAGGADPVFTIADLSDVWLVAAVRELDAPAVRVGQEVQVSVDALPGRAFPARIDHVATALDATTRRLAVRAAIADPERVLKPEMYASFRIAIGEGRGSVAVPVGALIYRGPEASVWEAVEETRFMLRPIRTGQRNGELMQVTEGLSPGARVVTGGALFVDRAATAD